MGTLQLKYPPTLVEKTEPNQKEKPWFLGVSGWTRWARGLGWDPLKHNVSKKTVKPESTWGNNPHSRRRAKRGGGYACLYVF